MSHPPLFARVWDIACAGAATGEPPDGANHCRLRSIIAGPPLSGCGANPLNLKLSSR